MYRHSDPKHDELFSLIFCIHPYVMSEILPVFLRYTCLMKSFRSIRIMAGATLCRKKKKDHNTYLLRMILRTHTSR